MGKRGTTFCENAIPSSTISTGCARKAPFTVQLGPNDDDLMAMRYDYTRYFVIYEGANSYTLGRLQANSYFVRITYSSPC